MNAWAVISGFGIIQLCSIATTEEESKEKMTEFCFQPWEYFESSGYTCERVLITKQ